MQNSCRKFIKNLLKTSQTCSFLYSIFSHHPLNHALIRSVKLLEMSLINAYVAKPHPSGEVPNMSDSSSSHLSKLCKSCYRKNNIAFGRAKCTEDFGLVLEDIAFKTVNLSSNHIIFLAKQIITV